MQFLLKLQIRMCNLFGNTISTGLYTILTTKNKKINNFPKNLNFAKFQDSNAYKKMIDESVLNFLNSSWHSVYHILYLIFKSSILWTNNTKCL